jgi:predicted RNA-binding protein YlxR (DUF448 family)
VSGRKRAPACPTSGEAQDPVKGPVRTCVGCRVRAAKTDLLRVVAVEGVCVPDPRGTSPGRGAYLHPDPACLTQAERRKAFPRALRVPGLLDPARVRLHLSGEDPQGQDMELQAQQYLASRK